ncbi:MAG: UDP-glucose 4-epimerase GalE [Hyphomicrobiales bacterium]|nr:UDP-glucose 4-epimerase GalE [Hyphomicrobiales bacterium]
MTVLVTGGAGYIGSHMVHELLDRGETVLVVDDLSTGLRRAVAPAAELVVANAGDEDRIAALMAGHGVEAVIHFAGSVVVPESVRDPLAYYLNNTVNSRALIQAAVLSGVKHFIFSSTAAVYGIPVASPVYEDAPLAPISPYGASKMMTETMLRDVAAAHQLRFAALRYFNVAGADPQGRAGQSTPQATHLIKVAAQAALGERSHLEIFGTDFVTPDGTGVRDYIHVTDLTRAHSAALAHLRGGGESLTLNCGYGCGYSVREVVASVKRMSGVDFPVREVGRREGDPPELVAGTRRILEALDWRPELDDLDTIVTHALAWERKLKTRAA